MKRTVRLRLHDVLASIDGIENAAAGKSFDDFRSNWVLRHAIQRGVEIISEACPRIPEELRQTQPEIPWRSILWIGNVLRHDYEDIADEIVWNVVQNHLPPLRKAITAMNVALPDNE